MAKLSDQYFFKICKMKVTNSISEQQLAITLDNESNDLVLGKYRLNLFKDVHFDFLERLNTELQNKISKLKEKLHCPKTV